MLEQGRTPVNTYKFLGGINYFLYGYNNPIIFSDPYGLKAGWDQFLKDPRLPPNFSQLPRKTKVDIYNAWRKEKESKYKGFESYEDFSHALSATNKPGNPSNDIIGGSAGWEVHALLGMGQDVHYCCDKNKRLWRVNTFKTCLGIALGASGGANIELSKNVDNCSEKYKGPTFEVGLAFAEASVSISQDPVVSGGLTKGAGGKFTPCWYFVTDSEEVGSCCGE